MVTKKQAKQGEEFVFCNGHKAKSVTQCRNEIKKLNHEEFTFHVNADKNDFFNWINDCIDQKTAEKIKEIKDQKEMIVALK